MSEYEQRLRTNLRVAIAFAALAPIPMIHITFFGAVGFMRIIFYYTYFPLVGSHRCSRTSTLRSTHKWGQSSRINIRLSADLKPPYSEDPVSVLPSTIPFGSVLAN
jgi:hypothetical protein